MSLYDNSRTYVAIVLGAALGYASSWGCEKAEQYDQCQQSMRQIQQVFDQSPRIDITKIEKIVRGFAKEDD